MQAPAPQPSPPAVTAFAPLPLRARGVLEILDLAIKVYKQYFWVLLGWSTLVIIGSGIGAIIGMAVPFGGSLPSAMLTPLITGVVSCCIAAAVRGQKVEFRQCWEFTKPRFWPMVGFYLLALMASTIIIVVFAILCALIFLAGAWAFSSAPQNLQMTMLIIGVFLLITVGTVVATVVFSWHYLVPIVVCMEEDKMNIRSLVRAYELLKRRWVPVCTLMTVVGLGMIFLLLILWAVSALLIGLPELQKALTGGQVSDTRMWQMIIASVFTYVLLWVIWTPIFHLIMVLFYLDVRIRQEALDLEWAAHVTAPPLEQAAMPAPLQPAGAGYGFAPVNPTLPPTGYPAASGVTPAIAPQAQPNMPPPGPAPFTPAVEPQPAPVPPEPVPPRAANPPTPVAAAITCPSCGSPALPTHVFCMRCGTRLTPPAQASPEPSLEISNERPPEPVNQPATDNKPLW